MKEKKYSLIITSYENSRREIIFDEKFINNSYLLSAIFLNADEVVLSYTPEVFNYLEEQLSGEDDNCDKIEYELMNDLYSLHYIYIQNSLLSEYKLITENSLFNSKMLGWAIDYMEIILNKTINITYKEYALKNVNIRYGKGESVLSSYWDLFLNKGLKDLIDLLKKTYITDTFISKASLSSYKPINKQTPSSNLDQNPINGMEIPVEKSILMNTKRHGVKGLVINNFTLEECIEKCQNLYKENETFPIQEAIVCFIALFQDMPNLLYFRDFNLNYRVLASINVIKEKLTTSLELDIMSEILEVENKDLIKLLRSV